MPTLYVENVPNKLYEALRKRARKRRTSIAAEVLALLEENVPAADELARRKDFLRKALGIRARRSPSSGPFPTSEEMQREDRGR
jgi:plasmid stability protein